MIVRKRLIVAVVSVACVLALAAFAAGCSHEPTTPAATQTSVPQPAQLSAGKGPFGGYPPPPSIAKQIQKLQAKGKNSPTPAGSPPVIGSH